MSEEEKVKEPSEFAQHMKAARKARKAQLKSLIPESFWEHGREAQREMLLAMRSLVDGAIEHLEKADDAPKQTGSKKSKAKVEVE